jgi:RimJ/RimL family protein N-acetyltransferase
MSPLAAKQFVMRPMNMDDVETVTEWLQDIDDLSLFDRSLTVPLGKEAVRDGWKADLAGAKCPTAYWFIVETGDRTPVALAGLQAINYVHGDAVLPILVVESARGQGLGLRIAALLLDVAFDRLRLRRVTTFFRADNLRTERLTRRAGFQVEGRMREAWFVGGRHLDAVVVGLLREEWHARREALRAELGGDVAIVFGRPGAGPTPRPHRAEASLKAL